MIPGGVTGNTANAAGREALINSISNWQPMIGFTEEGKLLPKGSTLRVDGATTDTETYGVVIYWNPGSNDNNWNVNNGKEVSDINADKDNNYLHIDLGVKLVATQLVAEKDSFGPDYDEDADPL